ncbi:MAG: glycolate oxidase binding subunit [Thermoleophilaceae bacterium]|nr:glycolate oxidase binding subunit [Thermoleophilaceae bacterium]
MAASPRSYEKLAAALRNAGRARVIGAGTKSDWGAVVTEPRVDISTRKLDSIIEHNTGDLTAVVQAGVPLARLREQLAGAQQMLAIDPPLGAGDAATVGGVLATADSGPLRHRYGGPRDLVLGMTVALSDGAVARSGGKVIKNVAGYDLAKLFTGSYGTLGAILEVAVRLHPLPAITATAVGRSDDPAAVARAAAALTHAALEAQCLDVSWAEGSGRVLARFAGGQSGVQAAEALAALEAAGLVAEIIEDDAELWDAQRRAQRSADGLLVRVSGVQTLLETQMRAADRAGGSLVGRAAGGLSWMALPLSSATDAAATLEDLRRELSPSPCVLLDAPPDVRERVEVWGVGDGSAVELMRRVKQRFDPAGACSPGAFVGGI